MNEQQKQFVLSLLAYAVQRGVSADELCKASDLDVEALRKKTGPAITETQLTALWKNVSKLCDDPWIGLHFGESLQLAALGVVGEIIKSSETVGQAVTIAASFTLVISDLFAMQVEKGKDNFTIQLKPIKPSQDEFVSKQIADFLLVFTLHELNGFLLQRITPNAIHYPYAVDNADEYKRVFHHTPDASGNFHSIEFDIKFWDEPIITANYEVQRLFLEKITMELNKQDSDISFQVRVMDYLMKNSYLGILSLEDVAANFNITPRSLQRRLQEESTTFQQIADSVRKSLAIHYMESGKYQIKEISSMLGYNEISAFSRAFKRWTGKAPMGYQA